MKELHGRKGLIGTVTDADYELLVWPHEEGYRYVGMLGPDEFINQHPISIRESKAEVPSLIVCKHCRTTVQNDVESLLQHEDFCSKEYS